MRVYLSNFEKFFHSNITTRRRYFQPRKRQIVEKILRWRIFDMEAHNRIEPASLGTVGMKLESRNFTIENKSEMKSTCVDVRNKHCGNLQKKRRYLKIFQSRKFSKYIIQKIVFTIS